MPAGGRSIWLTINLIFVFFFFPPLGPCRKLSDVLWEAISNGQVHSLYQGLGTKNLQSFISQFVYFYGYSYFKRLYLKRSGNKSIGAKANLIIAATAGACTAIITQVRQHLASFSSFGQQPWFLILEPRTYAWLIFIWLWITDFQMSVFSRQRKRTEKKS